MARVIEITTPLDRDVLLFHSMRATEEMSRLFEYDLVLLSEDPQLPLDDLLGNRINIALELVDGGVRHFNGLCGRISQGGRQGRFYVYHATVRPWMWFMTRTRNCRIFQEQSVPDILKEMFQNHSGIANVRFELTESYGPWTYCVQYQESDFAFVSRLMEHEGIYYFFKHAEGEHTLVVADSRNAHVSEYDEDIPFIAPEERVRPEKEHVSQWSISRELQTGRYALAAYDFEKPSVDLNVRSSLTRPHALAEYEVFEYGGDYVDRHDGENYAHLRIEEQQSKYERVKGETNARALASGDLFRLNSHPRTDQNDEEYLVVSAQYELRAGEYESRDVGAADYRCTFTALNAKQPFRAERLIPKPIVQGPQTAVVVGPAGEEIYKDDHERVKVQFHWDRYGKRNEDSSCWIRVSQPWAGKGWGSMSTPRIGQEVIIDFLEGDPDQPIITGRVYNAENMPPHGGVVSGLKSNTHKGSGYNEMTMDDTAGKEKITIHGQYDMNTTVEHDQTNTVKNDMANTVTGKYTEEIGKDTSITIKTGKLEHKVNTGTASYYVKAAVTQKFDNIWDSKVTGKVSIKSNSDIEIDSDTKITLVTGGSKLVMESTGAITLTGTKISVTGKELVNIAGTNKTEVTGGTEAKFGTGGQNMVTNTAKTAISGAAINSSAIGMHEITGAVVKIN